MLPPSAIAGVSLVCALGPWVFTEPMVLRGLAAAAAATAVIGAVVLRRWDTQAGKRVADLTRARASDEWRFEERVAELEADLDESRELRAKLEQRLRAKRTELAGLRNEHAALLRRYATSETERASVLEDRRMLEIEATAPVRAALPAGASDTADTAPDADGTSTALAAEEEPAVPAVFSPEGSRLFLRAAAALARFDGETVPDPDGGGDGDGVPKGEDAEPAQEQEQPEQEQPKQEQPKQEQPEQERAEQREQAPQDEAQPQSETDHGHERTTAETSVPTAETSVPGDGTSAPGDGTAESAGGTAESAGGTGRLPEPVRAEQPAGRRSGHYTVPTAVAVPPQSPVRRPQAGGGFDFFGTKAGTSRAALEAVQNEDLADVVGQEALALHKAETEARYKPADEESRGIGQVIDLTAHDETEQIDVQGLRSAVS
jgi:TolA-binding protein